MNKHTAAPWEISTHDYECNDTRIVIRAGNALIATVGNGGATSDHLPTAKRWKVESRANAQLIVAAPDLLAALEMCIVSLEYAAGEVAGTPGKKADWSPWTHPNHSLIMAKAAIARATFIGGGKNE